MMTMNAAMYLRVGDKTRDGHARISMCPRWGIRSAQKRRQASLHEHKLEAGLVVGVLCGARWQRPAQQAPQNDEGCSSSPEKDARAAAAAAAHDAARSREGGLRTAAGARTGARGLAAP